MKTQARRAQYLPLIMVGIAVILFSTAAIAAILGWRSASTDGSGDTADVRKVAVAAVEADPVPEYTAQRRAKVRARAKGRCAECGVIVSIGKMAMHEDEFGSGAATGLRAGNRDESQLKSARRYDINVRMADGSSHVVSHASPANWRTGERVIIIAGANPSRR